ncbi:flagellin [Endozoicomonas ascidiicola]|uniref:flagellin N-terminal helical domain-containing protein n=1 Tax=Endozoicomonas ascidiicola TaxID=1698521 RepID=UPI00082E61E3|nr:flagellin [Endozoicomonas ascidiicola]
MAMTVNTNVFSLNAQRQLMSTESGLQTSMQRLSSGLRINSAKDDAAGLQIANRLQSQASGLSVAIRNGSDGISLAQTAEGALNESTAILQRMRDLALQASNDSNGIAERTALNDEVTALKAEMNRISTTTSFGGVQLLDGTFTSKSFQVGSTATAADKITFSINSASASDLGTGAVAGVTLLATIDSGDISHGSREAAETVAVSVDGGTNSVDVNFTNTDTAEDIASKLNAVFEAEVAAGDLVEGALTAVVNGGGDVQVLRVDADFATVGNFELDTALTAAGDLGILGEATTSATLAGTAGAAASSVDSLNLTTSSGADDAVSIIDKALSQVDSERAMLGATQNRLTSTINNLANIRENVTASKSRIMDTDFAMETANLSKYQVMQQAGTAILSQANAMSQNVLALLR